MTLRELVDRHRPLIVAGEPGITRWVEIELDPQSEAAGPKAYGDFHRADDYQICGRYGRTVCFQRSTKPPHREIP